MKGKYLAKKKKKERKMSKEHKVPRNFLPMFVLVWF